MHRMDAPLAKATRELRKRFDYSQKDLARRLGIGHAYLCNLEKGRHTYSSIHIIRSLSAIYGFDVYLYAAVTFVPLNWYAKELRPHILEMRAAMEGLIRKQLGE